MKVKDINLKFVIPITLILVLGVVAFNWFAFNQLPNRGEYGDMFGAANTLFSGLAFGGIIVTILLQGKELSLQREELIATRNVFLQQSRTMTQQRFETTFFNLITHLSNTKKSLKATIHLNGVDNKFEGADLFEYLLKDIELAQQDIIGEWEEEEKKIENQKIFVEACNRVHRIHEHFILNYIRQFDFILNYIHDHSNELAIPSEYYAILASVLSEMDGRIITTFILAAKPKYDKTAHLISKHKVIKKYDWLDFDELYAIY
ncbi:hypothetical protein [Croceiramulus getboli]|nr:hypothetical protein P8624_10050 [Flavobacteriaceae bacterium YJPT1-3]